VSPEEKTRVERERKRVYRAKKAFEVREMDVKLKEEEAAEKKKSAVIGLNSRRYQFWNDGARTLEFAREEIALEKKLGVGVNDPVTDKDGLPDDLILHMAADWGCVDSVKALVEAGADVNLPGVVPWTPYPNALFSALAMASNSRMTPPFMLAHLTGILDIVYYLRTETKIT
jgi:ankyrin repeat protein